MSGQCPNVVDAVDVIGVIVGKEDRIDVVHSGRDQLEPQLGRRVDQNPGASVRLDEGADAGPPVARVRRPANRAAASNLGYAETGSRPKERQPQMVSTLSRLVVPGMSKGTPAVTMMRSPLDASSRATTASFARVIISS